MLSTTGSRHLFISLLAIASLLVSLSLALDDDPAWEEFKSKFNKTYSSEEEELQRKKIFYDNKQFIESHNTKEIDAATFTQGINPLSDLSTEEINQSRNGFRLPDSVSHLSLNGILETLLLALNDTMRPPDQSQFVNETESSNFYRAWYDSLLTPEKLDFRDRGRVSRVKDQGSCGSCWAFATTGALESMLAAHDRKILLSEQNLVDCSRRYGNYGCSGGLMDAALHYVRDHGIMSSSDYPYKARDNACKFRSEASVTRVRGAAVLPRGNENMLRLALALSGPLPVAMDASGRSFHSYKSGVYNDKRSCSNNPNRLNHAVLLVGYGTDKRAGDYWILKNSWGTKWGDNGYFKLARNRGNLCGVASYAVLPIPARSKKLTKRTLRTTIL